MGREVPVTTALGGVVFIAVLFCLASPVAELLILAAWALVYAAEIGIRNIDRLRRGLGHPEARAAAISAVLLGLGALATATDAPRALAWALYAGVYIAAGWGSLVAGLQALRSREIDVELLMVVAALCAAGVGKPFDGALLFVIFAGSRALAALARRRTRDSVRNLLAVAPEQARKVVGDGEELVPTGSLVPADELVVRPGERIGADGVVVAGRSDVDQATITGEFRMVAKAVGDEVFAGTMNGTGVLRIRVSRRARESVLARIVELVDQAGATKARMHLRLERIERRYSVCLVLATAMFLLVPLGVGDDFEPTLLRAMAFMIVASPCAFTLATMPALLGAIANAGRHGVLIKDADVIERLGTITTAAFDKTGSLTFGRPHVVDVAPLVGSPYTADDVLRLAGAVEQASEHPLAEALLAEARSRGLALPRARDFRSEPGRGVHAVVEGREIAVVSPSTFFGNPVLADAVRPLERGGCTVVVVAQDGVASGLVALRDLLRPDAAEAVTAVRAMTTGEPVLLTGDGAGAAAHAADEAGLTDVRSELLPADKVDALHAMQAAGSRVLYVGDGMNDAPALGAADVGVAMTPGADLAVETSDVVVVRGELAALPRLIALSQRARRVVRQNLVLSAAVVVVLVTLDIVGSLPLPAAVAGHEGSTLLVAVNGLRLLRGRAWYGPSVRRPADLRRFALGSIACAGLVLLAVQALAR